MLHAFEGAARLYTQHTYYILCCCSVHMTVQKTSHWTRYFVQIVVVVDGPYVRSYYADISRLVVVPVPPTICAYYVCV